ncbi:MAG: hypothetical protein ABSF09_14310 [Candidatus Bathyarchaeia archaeon]|jgi:hypothetical protein
MSQSTLLDSTKEKAGKFSVSVERVVNLGNYETLRIGLAEILDLASEKPEDAYTRIMQKVDGWTSQLKPTKPEQHTTSLEPAKPQPTTVTVEDRYLTLPWKQSMKKQNLGTIHVTPELLQNPLARELYDKVKEWKNLHVGHVAYRYSKMDNGTEFLQKWSPTKLG